MEELRKCPFCGGEAHIIFVGRIGHLVQCKICGNMTPWKDTGAEAITAWNRRTQNIGKKECCVQGGGIRDKK